MRGPVSAPAPVWVGPSPATGGTEEIYLELDVSAFESALNPVPETGRRVPARAKRRPVIRVTSRLDASPERVFDAWLDPAMASVWLFATALHPIARVEIDARIGGSFRFLDRREGRRQVEHTGEYLEIIPPRRLVFTLSMENSPRVVTRVTAEIVPLHAGCEVRIDRKSTRLNSSHLGISYADFC